MTDTPWDSTMQDALDRLLDEYVRVAKAFPKTTPEIAELFWNTEIPTGGDREQYLAIFLAGAIQRLAKITKEEA